MISHASCPSASVTGWTAPLARTAAKRGKGLSRSKEPQEPSASSIAMIGHKLDDRDDPSYPDGDAPFAQSDASAMPIAAAAVARNRLATTLVIADRTRRCSTSATVSIACVEKVV